MTKQSIFGRWACKPFILLAATVAITAVAYGRANYMTIFGDNGCSSSNWDNTPNVARSLLKL